MKITLAKLVVVSALLFLIGLSLSGSTFAKNADVRINHFNRLLHDMGRIIEEIDFIEYRTKETIDPETKLRYKRALVEDIENYLYRYFEYPLLVSSPPRIIPKDQDKIGFVVDIPSETRSKTYSRFIATSYALTGMAKGYEGFGNAINYYFDLAEKVDRNSLQYPVTIDPEKKPVRLVRWKADHGQIIKKEEKKVSFYGRWIKKENILSVNPDETKIESVKYERKDDEYLLKVATKDFVKGVRHYIKATDRQVDLNRPNQFCIFLPVGAYKIVSPGVHEKIDTSFVVADDEDRNHFIIESFKKGVTIIPISNSIEFLAAMEEKRRNGIRFSEAR